MGKGTQLGDLPAAIGPARLLGSFHVEPSAKDRWSMPHPCTNPECDTASDESCTEAPGTLT